MKRWYLLMAALLLVTACGESTPTATTAPAATATSQPTPTAVALSDLDFDPVIYEEGDLPEGFTPGQYGAVQPLKDLPTPDNSTSLVFTHNGKAGGSIFLAAYSDVGTAAIAMGYMGPHFGKDKAKLSPGVGEQAMHYDGADYPGDLKPSEIRFVRCGVIVNLFVYYNQLDPLTNVDTTINWAKRVDKRIKALVCP